MSMSIETRLRGIIACSSMLSARSAAWAQYTERAIKAVMLAQWDATAFEAHEVRELLVSIAACARRLYPP